MHMGGRPIVAAVVGAVLLGVVGAPTATGVEGDTTAPAIVSLTVTPDHADVTTADGVFNVTLRVADDASTVVTPVVQWTGPSRPPSGTTTLTKAAGTDRDSTWTGSFEIPRHSSAGRYPLSVTVKDDAGNSRTYTADELSAAGQPSFVDITDSDPDTRPPSITGITVTPSTVDVNGGPADVTFEVAVNDDLSGVVRMFVTITSAEPFTGNGGAENPVMALVSGSSLSGVWRGTTTIPRYAREGRWKFTVIAVDRVSNVGVSFQTTTTRTTGFDVDSDVQDLEPPRYVSATITPSEVDVHDSAQTVTVRVRVTDNLSGVAPMAGGGHRVTFTIDDPDTWGQRRGVAAMTRVSGTDLDGVYEGSFTVPKGAPTGQMVAWFGAGDRVANIRNISGAPLAAISGGVSTVLIYNTPLAPTNVSASPGDGSATVRWSPPLDERGAAVTEYVVRTSPGGGEVRVPGSAREAVVGGLANGTTHTFTVAAVNKAGESDLSPAVTATPVRPRGSGYWMVGTTGDVFAFGDARPMGNAPVGGTPAVDIEATADNGGYWVVDAAGHVFAFGNARHFGGAGALAVGETVTSLSATPDGGGYWLFTNRGRVLRFGNAPFLGDMSSASLNGPVLDSVATPSGQGYYMVASDGGVFAFGDARFAGSMASTRLNAPVQSLVPDPDGSGYWLVASDGGIFAFSAPFHGSMGSTRLNRPVTGMVGSPTGGGYLMVAEDGGIFAFGDVVFRGSLGSSPPASPVTAVTAIR